MRLSNEGQYQFCYLDDRENIDEIQALNLVRLQTMRTFHARKNCNNLFCQSTG